MKGQKLYYRIGEVSRLLGVKPHVIRYWEQEFGLRPKRGLGMQRRYTPEDIERLRTIKKLLYEEGYKITGAKKRLKIPLASTAEGYRDLLLEVLKELKEIGKILS